MDKEAIKKKNDLMKSIMLNPKLSKTFRDAMSAPIGSTKREQAKSVLSIMRKVGGISSQDGKGGPYDFSGSAQPSLNISSTPPNYSNLLVFPATPAFKTPAVSGLTIPGAKPTNSGINVSGNPTAPSNSFSGIKPLPTPNSGVNLTLPNMNKPVSSGLNQNGQTLFGTLASTVTPPGATPPSDTTLTPGQFGGDGQPGGATRSFIGPVQPTQSSGATRSFSDSSGLTGSKVSSPAPQMSEGDRIKQSAQSAVNEGTGPGLFAMGIADEKFGGSLSQYIANLDDKLKKDFNLEPLETELSNLKGMRNNLVPTLTTYIQGKDQYLKFIDKLVDKTEGQLLKQDMGNPAVANSYNNYLQYLYGLRGRQNQRYGNFLNSAIKDYEADVETTQSNYDNIATRYSDAITRQGTIAQNEYNTLYTAMSDLYTNLEQAPIKRANLEALRLQNLVNTKALLDNGADQGIDFNWDNVKKYSEMISDKDGNLDESKIPPDGLVGLYKMNVNAQGTEAELTEGIRRVLEKTLQSSGNPATISKIKGMINQLSDNPDPAGAYFAGPLNESFSKSSSSLLSSYILDQIDPVKSATSSLLKSSSGFLWTGLGADKPGLKDKEGWLEKNSSLDKDFLESLYNSINATVTAAPEYGENPDTLIKTIFSGETDEENAKNLASIIAVS